ncbi:MAG: diguanylate cyclase [Gemmatimonadetes bacterium]|nr:diguanylate cyclase [Gemmatimonadota bacterium]
MTSRRFRLGNEGSGDLLALRIGAPDAPVPVRALLISAAALAVPLLSPWYQPELAGEQLGVLLWLPSLVPAFLLTYYRGWRGASLALAVGMALLAFSQVALALRGGADPNWTVLLALIAALVGISLGIGWVGELLHRARREAENMALMDPLTGIANRRHLAVFIEAAFAAAERGGRAAIVLLDLDRFKELNGSHGHLAGDAVLRVFARILTQQTRRADLSARFGGDEFVTVLTGADVEEALAFVERVREALAAEPFPWGAVKLSAGVASYSRGLVSPDALLAEADRGLYQAKELGGDQAVVWEPEAKPEPALVAVAELEGAAVNGETPAAAASSPRSQRRRGRGRVLIVDDDTDALWMLAQQVTRLGFHVDLAHSGNTSLVSLRSRAPDIVLSDVVMPGMGGFALADRIAREHPGLPVILVSGYDHRALAEERRPQSVVGFLTKPVDLRELGVVLEHSLAGTPGGRTRRA